MGKEYGIIVVGAGLIGSAAVRHLVEISNDVKVLMIGPEEPKVSVTACHLVEISKHVKVLLIGPEEPKVCICGHCY